MTKRVLNVAYSKTTRVIIYSIELVLCFVIQSIPGALPSILGAAPVLVLSLAFSLSAFESPEFCVVFGAVCGALADIGSGKFIGPAAVTTALMCLLFSYLFTQRISINVFYSALFSALGIFAVLSFMFLCNYALYDYGNEVYFYVNKYLDLTILDSHSITLFAFPCIYRSISK